MPMFNSYVSLPEGTYGKSPNLFLKQVNQWSQFAIFNSYVKLEGNIAFICFTGFVCQIFLIETDWSDNDIVSLCGGETTRQNGVAGHVAPFFAVMHRADVVHGDTWHGGYSSLTWKTVRPPTKRWYPTWFTPYILIMLHLWLKAMDTLSHVGEHAYDLVSTWCKIHHDTATPPRGIRPGSAWNHG